MKNTAFAVIFALVAAISFKPSNGFAYYINDELEISDPLESINRPVYKFNTALDKAILRPAIKAYRFVVPSRARKGVHNFVTNLTEPLTFVNAILQGDVEHSFTTFWRFTLNTTLGLGGISDFADYSGLRNRKEDYGQTMGTYGVGAGPYIMLPVLGPSNGRDVFGAVVDVFLDPLTYTLNDYQLGGRGALSGLDKRNETHDVLEEVYRVSLDPYATVRSLYTQRRVDEINNGKKPN